MPHLAIPDALWRDTVQELHARGAGKRESGAFLLARRTAEELHPTDAPTVITAAYYDDLDADCLTGGITISGTAYDRLWQRCREEGLRVVADVHTHPGDWVGQSQIDRANPMMGWVGHLALIVGQFADPTCMPARVGVYRYLGNRDWESLQADEANLRSPAECGSRFRLWVSQLRQGRRR